MVYTTYLRWFGGWFIYPNVLFFANKDDYIEPIEQPGEFECCMCGSPGVPHWNRRIRSLDIKQNTYFEFPIWTHIHVIPTGDLQCLMDHVLHMYIYIYYDMYIHAYTWYIHIDTHHSKKHVHNSYLPLNWFSDSTLRSLEEMAIDSLSFGHHLFFAVPRPWDKQWLCESLWGYLQKLHFTNLWSCHYHNDESMGIVEYNWYSG
jgi:hypothetical protein